MKNKLIAFTFILILGIGLTLTFTLPDKKMSTLERRKLTTKEVLESGFVENLDDYMSEQIPFRNTFLAFGSAFERYILQNEESNDSYIKDGYIIEKNYPLDEVSIDNFIKKLNFIADKVTTNGDVFYSVIPDKSYYLNADSSLKLDYDDIETKLRSSIEGEYIDILECFELSDYYKTDIHLKQEAYFKILDKFLDRVGIKEEDIKYEKKTLDDFYGASFSKVPFFKPESIEYFSNDILENVHVSHLESGKREVYDFKANTEMDLYNIFLSGPSALVEIENEGAYSDRELIIFRDSFASSMTPLLTPYFKKITLIDLRYISLDYVLKNVDFQNKDILFLYSTLIINKSSILKVNVP